MGKQTYRVTQRTRTQAEAEFPTAFAGVTAAGRREVLKAMGASLALAGLAGCGDPDLNARPYVTAPDDEVLGRARRYATAVTFAGYAQPVLGTTHEGRPTKLEGMPEHPACEGAADAFTQAALLGLYDPGRSKGPRRLGRATSWAAFDTAMAENAARLDANGGEGFRLLTGATSSPTFRRQAQAMLSRWPKARWHVFEPVGRDMAASRLAFGRPLEVRPRLEAAQVVVSFDDDLLGPGPRQTANARAWSRRRHAFQAGDGAARLLVAEPSPSLTGAMASDRLIASAAEVERLVQALASGETQDLTARQAEWVRAAARAIGAKPALVTAGPYCSPEIQALAWSLSDPSTLALNEPLLAEGDSLAALTEDLRAGAVDTLAVIGANPAYTAPADLDFAEAMQRARFRIHAGLHRDETARLAHWHAPLEHDLETWSDALAVDGRPSLIQPLVRPFHAVRSRHAVLETLQGKLNADARLLVKATWPGIDWEASLERGFLDQPAPEVSAAASAPPAPALKRPGGLTVLIRPDPTVWDGALAANAWLQELPKPFNKVTWDNVVALAPSLAKVHGLANGDVVRIEAGGRQVEGPVWITPGQERRTLVVHLGYGGKLADGAGYDAYPLKTTASPWRIDGAAIAPTGRRQTLASTQLHTALDGYDFVRTAPLADVAIAPPKADPPSFYPAWPKEGEQWGMAIDTDVCIGCNACVTACDAENNIPMVGRAQVAKGREMHWLRIDQYYEGEAENPRLFNQPVPCMHCEQAPCEMGCPVNAAVHSHDGLNLQVYNRCIGTRTCSSFCPYKVRRFNWFDFTGADPPELRAARNPDVTVRDRGIMEKCTYCVQRITRARIEAKVDGRPLAEGDVVTACQQTCPTDAIQFGNVNDPTSAVSRLKAQKRNYALLEEVNTRPRTTYLARLEDEDG